MKRLDERGPRPPMQFLYRRDLPLITWIGGDYEPSMEIALQNLDRGFEVLYDRSCAPSDMSPSHGLYRCLRRGGSPNDDYFVLEFMLQYDMDKGWPHGKPRAPGMWLVEEVKKRMAKKDAFGGDTLEKNTERQVDALYQENQDLKEAKDKASDELHDHKLKELHTFAVKGKVSESFSGKKGKKK